MKRKLEQTQMKELLIAQYDFLVDAPTEYVFKCVNDDEMILQWNDHLVENVYECPEDQLNPKAGSRFKSVQLIEKKKFTVDAVLTVYEPPYRVDVSAETKEGTSTTSYQLSREGGYTRLMIEVTMIPSNWFYRMNARLFGWAARMMYLEQFEKLEKFCEENYTDGWDSSQ